MLLFILGAVLAAVAILRFNTSHVTLYQIGIVEFQELRSVSIHLMLLFISDNLFLV